MGNLVLVIDGDAPERRQVAEILATAGFLVGEVALAIPGLVQL